MPNLNQIVYSLGTEHELIQLYFIQMLKLYKEVCFNRYNRINLDPSNMLRFQTFKDMCNMMLPFIQNVMAGGLADKRDDDFTNSAFNTCLMIIQNCLSSRMIDSRLIKQMGDKAFVEIMKSVCILIGTIPIENIYVRNHLNYLDLC